MNPIWMPAHLVVRWHARLIERFGGAPGLRDMALLEGALARPQNHALYDENASLVQLAAIYAVAVAKSHAFVDGNKRIGFAVMVAFLKANGMALDATEHDATSTMLGVADGSIDDKALEHWLLGHCHS